MAWYNASWTYRVKVTVLATEVDADLTDFPVYVNLNSLPAGFHTHCNQTDARDIRVTTADETTEVPREVVFYTAATDTGELWFKGTLADASNTDFYIYYGNAAATEPAADATYGSQNVWTAGYKGVWHQQTDFSDSTSNGNDLTGSGGTASPSATTGQVNGGFDFEATSAQQASITSNASLSLTQDVSISTWIKPESSGVYALVSKRDPAWAGTGGGYLVYTDGDNKVHFTTDNTSPEDLITDGTVSIGNWNHIAAVYNYGTGKKFVSINGTAKTVDTSGTYPTNAVPFALGTDYQGAGTTALLFYDGILDETRISNDGKGTTWVTTEYSNQSVPGSFYTIGSEETGATSSTSIKDIIGTGIVPSAR